MQSSAGTILDPAADKLLMLVTTLSFSLPSGPQVVPLSIASLIIGRDLFLAFNSFWIRRQSLKLKYTHYTSKIFWDFYHYPSVEVKPTIISKWNTFFQMLYLGPGAVTALFLRKKDEDETEAEHTLDENNTAWFDYFGYFVGCTTILSGMSYIGRSKYTTKLIK
ncbi:related to Cardiolipin synthase [Saccharomycodes ludwigii]|uniref:Related to Cardiolipin synthase n=2 Tax=Saccharomycodes ludwigii TaxID=36035 RepID=A0A376B3R6_9ASCO|nr:related to Cardiolipin synthase [Saccharomycodes ludwigii]